MLHSHRCRCHEFNTTDPSCFGRLAGASSSALDWHTCVAARDLVPLQKHSKIAEAPLQSAPAHLNRCGSLWRRFRARTRSMASLRQEQAPRMDYGSGSREGPVARSTPTPDMASVPPLPRLALRRRPRRPILDPSATRCDAGVPPPRGSSDAAQPSSTLFHSPLISPPHINPLSLTTSHPFASLAGSRRHRGRPVLRPLYSRMWAVLGAMWTQREPHAQNCTLHLLGVSVLGRVAACMLVFRPAVEPCPCRAMSVRVRGACPCMAVVHLRVCT